MAKRKQKPKTTEKPKNPSVTFNLMKQTWRSVAWAACEDDYTKISDAITAYIADYRSTDNVEIDMTIDCCRLIARACANHGIGAGRAFATVASSYDVESNRKPPADAKELAEAVARVKDDMQYTEIKRGKP